MSTLFFIQKFSRGEPVAMPYQAILDCLTPSCTAGRGPVGDVELVFEAESIAHYGIVAGDAEQGVLCIALVRPVLDNAMRRLVFELMSRFGASVFDDALGWVYVPEGGSADLPAALAAASTSGVQSVSSPQQLWPAGLLQPAAAQDRPALLFKNPNPQGQSYIMCDWADLPKKHLYLEMATRPEACNAGTLRALQNLLFKVDMALSANPEFSVFYRFAHSEAQLLLLESPRIDSGIGDGNQRVTFVVSGEALLGGEVPGVPFVMEPELYFTNRARSAEFIHQAEIVFGVHLKPGAAGSPELENLLDLLHQRYLQERDNQSAAEHVFSEFALHWADRAGAFLGEAIRSEIGGQWGSLELAGQKCPVVQTHTEHRCFPKLQVLNRIINGSYGSVSDCFNDLSRQAKSATSRQEDIASDIPLISHILMGRGQFSSDDLPLRQQLDAARLDFSVASLQTLDRYLAAIHQQYRKLDESQFGNLVLASGAYLGEVLRRHASQHWQWVNYRDYFTTRPANPDLPENLNSCVLLVGAGYAVLPVQACNVATWGSRPKSMHAQMLEWLELGKPEPDNTIDKPSGEADRAGPKTQPQDFEKLHDQQALDIQVNIAACMAELKPQERVYASMQPPLWIGGDQLERVFRDMPMLLSRGRVVWAHIVQANQLLFSAGMDDCPAEIVYDPQGKLLPEELGPVAHQLYQLKNTRPAHPELAAIANHLTDEMTRASGMTVPALVTGSAGKSLLLSTIFVARKHLPGRRLVKPWFPVLICDSCPGSAMILPSRWWPATLAQEWGGKPADRSLAPIDKPSASAAKTQLLHIVTSPVPEDDAAAWKHLQKLLVNEQARQKRQTRPAAGFISKLFGAKPAGNDTQPPSPAALKYAKYLSHMNREYPNVHELVSDMGSEVLMLRVARTSVNYVVETARREFGLVVFDDNQLDIVYRPAQ